MIILLEIVSVILRYYCCMTDQSPGCERNAFFLYFYDKTLNSLNALRSYYGLICLSVGCIECFINDDFTEFCLLKTLP